MRSSTGQYFIGLDHVRALAAFVVFAWHFIHVHQGQHAPPPLFPLSLLTEGHTGVGIFMVLSGYLFAKLLEGKSIVYSRFIWNRCLRLAPLLILVIVAIGVKKYIDGEDVVAYGRRILAGAIRPSLPNGGWSITAEFHFYLLLPFLLFLTRQWKCSLVAVLVCAILLRTLLYVEYGQIQTLSYWTIVGRIDQFLLGMLAFRFRGGIAGRHGIAIAVFVLFACFYWYFDALGGFYKSPSYPSPSTIWIYLPTLEGLAYAVLIAWYDNSFEHSKGAISDFIARIGTYSYSIYLLHFFVVFRLSEGVDRFVMDLSNIHWAMFFAVVCFFVMVPIGYLSYRIIELPFLRFRSRYVVSREAV